MKPSGWCWCGDIWMIDGQVNVAEGGRLHTRAGCWERGQVTYQCCQHCTCQRDLHPYPCPVEGCIGQVGSTPTQVRRLVTRAGPLPP